MSYNCFSAEIRFTEVFILNFMYMYAHTVHIYICTCTCTYVWPLCDDPVPSGELPRTGSLVCNAHEIRNWEWPDDPRPRDLTSSRSLNRSAIIKVRMVSCGGQGSVEGNRPPKTVNIILGYFFMVNFCLGTGFLGVPYSFYYSGYMAAIPTLIVSAFVTWLTSTWLLEVMARAQVSNSAIHLHITDKELLPGADKAVHVYCFESCHAVD